MADVFLSYASEDRNRVLPLVQALEHLGLSIWWDRAIHPGVRFEEAIESELASARCVLVAWSSTSVHSSWVYNEASVGLEQNKLVPLHLDDVRPPLAFRHLNTASLVEWSGSVDDPEFRRISHSIQHIIDGERSPAAVSKVPERDAPVTGRRIAQRNRRVSTAFALVLLVLLTGWLSSSFVFSTSPSITVLNFVSNESGDGQYLASDISDQVRNLITRSTGVRVTARALSTVPQDQVKRLNVEYLLEGTVDANEEEVWVDVHLVQVETGLRAWSNQLRKPRKELLDLSFDITQGVLVAMNVTPDEPDAPVHNRPTSNPEAYERYLEGVQWITESGNAESLERATIALESALAEDPSFGLAYSKLCEISVQTYRRNREAAMFEKAESQCRRALELNDYQPEAHASLGNLYMTAGRSEEALDAYTRAVNLLPNDPDMALGLGHVLLLAGQITRAEQWYQRAQAIAPEYWRVYDSMGSMHFRFGRYADSVAAYQRATELNPQDSVSWAGLNAARTMTGDLVGALTASQSSLALEPSAMALSNTASASYFVHDYQAAESLYRQALELEPDNHILWGNLGETLAMSNSSESAIAAFAEAERLARQNLEINSRNPEVLSRLATYLAFLNNSGSEPVELIEAALDLSPDDPYVEYDATLTYLRLNRLDTAREHLNRSRELGYPQQLVQADPQLAGIRN